MKAELEKRLLDAAKTMNIPDSLINEIFEDYSQKIAMTVNPIDRSSAPFIIATLNAYSIAITRQFPEVEKAAQYLMSKTASACFAVPIKGGGQK